MSPAELRDLPSRGHVVGCHSHSHQRLEGRLGLERLRQEIVDSRCHLQQVLDDPIEDFCWVDGEEWSCSRPAESLIEEAGHRRAFMTNCSVTSASTHPVAIERVNFEADWSISAVRFYLSGAMDLAYAGKRVRIRRALLRETA